MSKPGRTAALALAKSRPARARAAVATAVFAHSKRPAWSQVEGYAMVSVSSVLGRLHLDIDDRRAAPTVGVSEDKCARDVTPHDELAAVALFASRRRWRAT